MDKAQLIEAIENMSVLELAELVKELEEKFGVSAAAPVAVAAAPAAGGEAAAAEEKTEFDVVLKAAGAEKIQKRPGGAGHPAHDPHAVHIAAGRLHAAAGSPDLRPESLAQPGPPGEGSDRVPAGHGPGFCQKHPGGDLRALPRH